MRYYDFINEIRANNAKFNVYLAKITNFVHKKLLLNVIIYYMNDYLLLSKG